VRKVVMMKPPLTTPMLSPVVQPSLLLMLCQLHRLFQILHALPLMLIHWLQRRPPTPLGPTHWKWVEEAKHHRHLQMCTISSKSLSRKTWSVSLASKLLHLISVTRANFVGGTKQVLMASLTTVTPSAAIHRTTPCVATLRTGT
jgi:hypothetical protein